MLGLSLVVSSVRSSRFRFSASGCSFTCGTEGESNGERRIQADRPKTDPRCMDLPPLPFHLPNTTPPIRQRSLRVRQLRRCTPIYPGMAAGYTLALRRCDCHGIPKSHHLIFFFSFAGLVRYITDVHYVATFTYHSWLFKELFDCPTNYLHEEFCVVLACDRVGGSTADDRKMVIRVRKPH